jgi:hypothetical protein
VQWRRRFEEDGDLHDVNDNDYDSADMSSGESEVSKSGSSDVENLEHDFPRSHDLLTGAGVKYHVSMNMMRFVGTSYFSHGSQTNDSLVKRPSLAGGSGESARESFMMKPHLTRLEKRRMI